MLQTVLTLHLLHGFAFIALPWGGATAIRRSAFHEYGLAETLKDNVLDDFPLGKRLLQFGIRSTQIPTAIMSTDLAGRNGRGWEMWLFRQMMYLKYCLPTIWLISVLTAWVLVVPVVFAVLAELGGILGLVAPSLALISLGFLLALTVLAAWCRTLVPEPVPLGRWLLSFYASIFVAFWCYLRTWFTDTLPWRGISYRLTWGGRVKEIIISPFFQKQNNLH